MSAHSVCLNSVSLGDGVADELRAEQVQELGAHRYSRLDDLDQHSRRARARPSLTAKQPSGRGLTRGYNPARLGNTLATLSDAGVPILEALQAAETPGSGAMRNNALDALAQVRESAPLDSALAGKRRLAGRLAMFAPGGGRTGQLTAP